MSNYDSYTFTRRFEKVVQCPSSYLISNSHNSPIISASPWNPTCLHIWKICTAWLGLSTRMYVGVCNLLIMLQHFSQTSYRGIRPYTPTLCLQFVLVCMVVLLSRPLVVSSGPACLPTPPGMTRGDSAPQKHPEASIRPAPRLSFLPRKFSCTKSKALLLRASRSAIFLTCP